MDLTTSAPTEQTPWRRRTGCWLPADGVSASQTATASNCWLYTSRSAPLPSHRTVPLSSTHRMAPSSSVSSTSTGEEIAFSRMILTPP